MIHPTAIVDASARLDASVAVGAYSIIGPEVDIGAGSWIGPHVVIHGPTRIGRENRIFQFCSLGDAPQHVGYRGEPTRLTIGDRNTIREYCTLNRGTVEGGGETVVGDDNFIMAYCHVAHDCRIGRHTVFANASSLAGHVHIGDYAFLGGFTLIHQYCRVGAHCMTGVNTTLFKDVPPFVTVAGQGGTPHGINVRGLRRRGFDEATVLAIKRAYKTVYLSDLRLEQALEEIERAEPSSAELARFVEFIKSSKRGIVR
ncbi:MAG: acyl-[acyl-carrier-protein]--UDP-N-acetylglucosamine O-acyltransferase [Candidatus Muproteobacteria bacterium RBG_16_60_9]|uniref:Acyl-[acyl-carrier-protein]--UDP-N-acetylglucosamine O-acyltransferase n=1 Tax=Candidatus Muproteobacteria bacterium RBG_16_60_9 TaxID=1817755 RepID=A0A1F6VHD9_9PROT|nr:MAG: acyl-[acyl-carrier-protein]--UDP-N-acetylglucosamine O-acyltransferase [Candidatus Muproteobacteria bacterium RBG_16_60_9]